MSFEYLLTDCNEESLNTRIQDAIKRGFEPCSEIKVMGHKPMIQYGKTLYGGGNYAKMSYTSSKYGVKMRKIN